MVLVGMVGGLFGAQRFMIVIMQFFAMRIVAMQMPAIKTMTMQLVVMQQTTGRRGQQIGGNCQTRSEPMDEHRD